MGLIGFMGLIMMGLIGSMGLILIMGQSLSERFPLNYILRFGHSNIRAFEARPDGRRDHGVGPVPNRGRAGGDRPLGLAGGKTTAWDRSRTVVGRMEGEDVEGHCSGRPDERDLRDARDDFIDLARPSSSPWTRLGDRIVP